jgi:serine/threonine protein kinase
MTSKFLSRLLRGLQKEKSILEASSVSTRPGAGTTLGVGTLINGRFRLEAEIGRGGLGVVYRAHDLTGDRDVAAKVINLDTANILTRGQFLQEADIHSRLHHPHIVAVHETGMIEVGAQELAPYIVMEWVQGKSLETIPRLTYARILEIGKQICEALEYIHQQGFVYRDLKPGNVLIETRGFQSFVKLMDFGLARPRGMPYLPNESSLAGSFFYLAPELIAGAPADVPSDLYALGVTLYEMITGRVPFSDFDEQTVLAQHSKEAITPLSRSRADVPPALEAIVLRLLAKNPEERFASAHEVHQALEQVTVAQQGSRLRGNLPLRGSTELVRRENEIAQIVQLLESNRLVTLLGERKSFSLAVGMRLADQFLDGVWMVELEGLKEPTQVLETVVAVLGVRRDPDRALSVSLIEHLREKNLLLLLEHCDPLLNACAQLVQTLLSSCPEVWILATSGQPLNVPNEKRYRVIS